MNRLGRVTGVQHLIALSMFSRTARIRYQPRRPSYALQTGGGRLRSDTRRVPEPSILRQILPFDRFAAKGFPEFGRLKIFGKRSFARTYNIVVAGVVLSGGRVNCAAPGTGKHETV